MTEDRVLCGFATLLLKNLHSITSDLAGVVWQPSRMASSFIRQNSVLCHLSSVFCPLSSGS
ncbi:MAG: hypothetical protein HY936_02570 [Nitrosomonadales bacterium]|nr:hypothetical protein [Nitrosomonadales bacterium]